MVLVVAFLVGLVWLANFAGWYQASFKAATVDAAATLVVQKYDNAMDQHLSLLTERSTTDPKVYDVAFRSATGENRYKVELKRVTPNRWVELSFEQLF